MHRLLHFATHAMMKRILIIYLLSCFIAVSFANADDLTTLRTFLQNKTDDQAALHSVYMACLSLTRTGTEEAVPVLTQLLEDERFHTVAKTALANIQGTPPLQRETPQMGIAVCRDAFLQGKGGADRPLHAWRPFGRRG